MKKVNKKPLVSVVMPTYNAGRFLVDAIDSILKQTYKNFELIIVNDASTDGSLELLKKYKRSNPKKIKIINLEQNLNRGGDVCANEGIKQAKGKYIARMDADDIAHPERIEKQVEFLEKHKNVLLLGSNAHVINAKGKIIGEKLEPLTNHEIYKSYCTFHPIIHPSAMYRRKLKDKIFQYEIKYSANNDYYTFFKLLCKNHRFANLPEKLIFYRIHGKNDTFVKMKEKFMNTLKVRIEMVSKFGYQPSVRDIAVSFIQAIILFALPEKTTLKLYLLLKGIVKPENPIEKIPLYIKRFALQHTSNI